jgi:hypothetical protein
MKRVMALALLALVPGLLLSGCGGSSTATTSSPTTAKAVVPDPAYQLTELPPEFKSVAQVREQGTDGQEVVVQGWVAGSLQPIIEGRAAFTIVDLTLPLPECTEEPYSYCCLPKEMLLPNLIMVKFVDDEGRTIRKDARDLLGIQEGSIVVVRGRIECSEDGVVNCIVADGLFDRGYSDHPQQVDQLQQAASPTQIEVKDHATSTGT